MKLTVACVFVKGHVPFTPQYVTRLKSMAQRLLPPHRFVCLTDQKESLPLDLECIPTYPTPGIFAWWSKLKLFDPNLPVEGRIIYFDLDVLLLGGLYELVEYPGDFCIAPDGSSPYWKPKDGRKVVKLYNSSVMVWDHGAYSELYTDWKPKEAARLWGDQDWIGEKVNVRAMPLEWFPRLSQHTKGDMRPEAKVLLCKKPKNALAASLYPWFAKRWQ